jgi:hypothetical protein
VISSGNLIQAISICVPEHWQVKKFHQQIDQPSHVSKGSFPKVSRFNARDACDPAIVIAMKLFFVSISRLAPWLVARQFFWLVG